jgi:hypothetical protein
VRYESHARILSQQPPPDRVGHGAAVLQQASFGQAASVSHAVVRVVRPRRSGVPHGFSPQVEQDSVQTGGTHGVTATVRESTD